MTAKSNASIAKEYILTIISSLFLAIGIYVEFLSGVFLDEVFLILMYALAYLPVGLPVIWRSLKLITQLDVFNEFFLMSTATVGAIILGEYAEGVAVMLFYSIGELFQGAAVRKAKRSIESLLELQVEEVTLLEDGVPRIVHPKDIKIGQAVQIRAGEKVALDGELLSNRASFNTSSLTGESMPSDIAKGQSVLAGMINLNEVCTIKVTAEYNDTKLSKILKLVQEAAGRKAPTQRFISKFAKVYTPIVVGLATILTFAPYLFVEDYVFRDWLYRALIFLVISCPCALVISIPLGYFGGLGAASRNGILVKGANYLDLLVNVDTVVMDKAGTLTKAIFEVVEVNTELNKEEFIGIVSELESYSSHPISLAIVAYNQNGIGNYKADHVEEIPGHGLKGRIDNKDVLAGNAKLLRKFGVEFDESLESISNTIVLVSINNKFSGYISIADTIKEDSYYAINQLHKEGIETVVMLSGDKQSVVNLVAQELRIDRAKGNLLPEDKVNELQKIKDQNKTIIFVGDGINDAPVIALADVGMAMGGLGSDAAIETADVIIQTDQPSKIATAIRIGKATKRIVLQNIILAFGIKFIVLVLGAGGLATMWEAVFADVGVALLAILNAVRIQRMRF